MRRRFFLGMAAGYTPRQVWRHTFAVGRGRDCAALVAYLEERYRGDNGGDGSGRDGGRGIDEDGGAQAILCKNGRSGLALALKAYFDKGDKVIVNGFTCYAVIEAVKAAGLTPVYADISCEDLNFAMSMSDSSGMLHSGPRPAGPSPRAAGAKSRAAALRNAPNGAFPDEPVKGIIVQNSLGNPVDMAAVEEFARAHDLVIIEDLAHCAGVRYLDGREAGTVGAAAVLSFGKDKMIDTVSGGAVVLRRPCKHTIKAPSRRPRPSDHLRARFYPLFGALCRGLTSVHLGGPLMRCLVKIHWVEKSADNRLDLARRISKFEARLALEQLQQLKKTGESPLRDFYMVRGRDAVLKELQQAGYYFGGFWYERPISPARYYRRTHFPEAECPNAVFVSEHIVNFPTYYSRKELAPARKIIKKHLIRDDGPSITEESRDE